MNLPVVAFNRPYISGSEITYMSDALARGHVSGDGVYTERASTIISELTSVPNVLLTTSCTHALEMAAILLDVGIGDEVILPSFTFVSCANAFVLRGARPVFVDIRGDTYNIDERLIEAAITPNTKAIVVVHYAGVACEMATILDIARRYGISVVEDAAHALGGKYHGTSLGSLGRLGTLSFHETKNVHCGEGGALLVSDPDLMERAEIVREKGTNRSRFFRGQVDKYTWADVGSSYLPSDLLAAFLTAQLESFDRIEAQRRQVWDAYATELRAWATSNQFVLPSVPPGSQNVAHLFGVLAPTQTHRDAFIAHLGSHAVKAVFHYVPLHSSPVGRRFAPGVELPVTDNVSSCMVRLPVYAGLRPDELERVLEAAESFSA